MNTTSQCKKIVEYMESNGSITAKDAYSFGCMRLAARIADIKRRWGYEIRSDRIKVMNADGSFSRVAKYSIEN